MKKLYAAVVAGTLLTGCSRDVAPTVRSVSNRAVILDGATVEVSRGAVEYVATSAEDGRFEMDGLGGGNWTITASKAGNVAQAINLAIAGDTSRDLSLDQGEQPGRSVRSQPVSRAPLTH